MQAKLKEALAAQPAAVDPREFAKAQDRITQLEKEKELLRVGLEQAQAKQPQAADLAMFDQTKKELESTKKQLVEAVANVASLTQENQKLRQDLASAQKSTGLESALKEARQKSSRSSNRNVPNGRNSALNSRRKSPPRIRAAATIQKSKPLKRSAILSSKS